VGDVLSEFCDNVLPRPAPARRYGNLKYNGTFGPSTLRWVAADYYNASLASNTWYLQDNVGQNCAERGMNLMVGGPSNSK
jgi:hypothetical protein